MKVTVTVNIDTDETDEDDTGEDGDLDEATDDCIGFEIPGEDDEEYDGECWIDSVEKEGRLAAASNVINLRKAYGFRSQ